MDLDILMYDDVVLDGEHVLERLSIKRKRVDEKNIARAHRVAHALM